MTEEIKEKIVKFIKNNNLTFEEGSRNTDSVLLSGYCLYLKLDLEDIDDICDIIRYTCEFNDIFSDEFERVFKYAKLNHYHKWWEIEENRKMYVIE